LADELRPWLVEFEKLGVRGQNTLSLIKLYEAGEYEKFWNLFEENRMDFEEQAAYLAHKSGTLKLQPFIENATDALANKYYSTVSGTPLPVRKAIGTFANLATIQVKPMFDGDKNSFYTSGDAQKDGSWFGMDLGEVTDVKTIIINQGRNVPNDVDYFDMARLEYSLDGENWTTLRDEINGVYDIVWEGSAVQARYVRLARNDASERQNWVAVRNFEVNPVKRNASIYTNVGRLVKTRVTTFQDQIVVKRVLEVITLNPGDYVGIELPYIATITNIDTEFNATLTAEYSQDGKKWSTTSAPCRYFRYINNGTSAVGMKMDKFEVTADLSAANGTENVFDKNFETTYTPTDEATIILPEGVTECTILMRSANGVKVKQLSATGEELAVEEVTSLYYAFSPTAEVKKIAITGNPEICEIVYKK
jgi:hyaluronoglucosaminidase